MGIFQKLLVQLNESDLLGLITDGDSENKTLDYKRDLPGQSEGEKKEFLYDASSFANTLGGDIVFVMEEQNGMAINLVGLAGINPDKEILRLQEILRDGIRPPITGVDPRVIELTNGNVAIVVRIPKSWNPPHQVTFQKAFRFYARDTNGKYQVDVDELRSIFSLSGMIAERIRAFRVERVAKIAAGDTPVPLLSTQVLRTGLWRLLPPFQVMISYQTSIWNYPLFKRRLYTMLEFTRPHFMRLA
jgi:Putative DNA-binding domain